MNLSFIKTGLFRAKQASPTTLMVVGIAGAITATVLACRATLKAGSVLEEMKNDAAILRVNKGLLVDGKPAFPKLTDKIYKAEISKVYFTSAGELTRLYAPAILVGVASIAAISGGHAIMLKRNSALATALTLTETAFRKYRKAIAAEIGDEREREIRYAVETEDVYDTKAGTVTQKKTAIAGMYSQYARFFDETNNNYDRNPNYNLAFLRGQQEYANLKLQHQGWLLLNDVYESLGYEKTSAGAVVGWAISDHGDNFVDFGIYNYDSDRARAFVNGDESAIILDFNVDGVGYKLIGDK